MLQNIENSGKVCNVRAARVQFVTQLQKEVNGFNSWPGVFLQELCMFSLCMSGLSPGTIAFIHSPEILLIH